MTVIRDSAVLLLCQTSTLGTVHRKSGKAPKHARCWSQQLVQQECNKTHTHTRVPELEWKADWTGTNQTSWEHFSCCTSVISSMSLALIPSHRSASLFLTPSSSRPSRPLHSFCHCSSCLQFFLDPSHNFLHVSLTSSLQVPPPPTLQGLAFVCFRGSLAEASLTFDVRAGIWERAVTCEDCLL